MLLATNLREELLLHVDASGLLTSMEFVFPDGTSCDAAAPVSSPALGADAAAVVLTLCLAVCLSVCLRLQSKLKSVFRSKASVQAPQTVSMYVNHRGREPSVHVP